MNQWMFKNGVDISQSRKGGPKPAMKGLKENRKTARHAAPGERMSAWASWSPTERLAMNHETDSRVDQAINRVPEEAKADQ